MIELAENGRVTKWTPILCNNNNKYEKTGIHDEDGEDENSKLITKFEEEIDAEKFAFKCSGWEQFTVLFRRASKQIIHDKVSNDISVCFRGRAAVRLINN